MLLLFLIPYMIEVPRRNNVSLKSKAAVAAAAPLPAASTSTSAEVIPDPHDDCILDVPEMPDIPPSEPTDFCAATPVSHRDNYDRPQGEEEASSRRRRIY